MSYNYLNFDINDGVAIIKLNRPDTGNTFNPEFANELDDVARRCLLSKSIRSVLLADEGRLFSGGGDLLSMAEAGEEVGVTLNAMADRLHSAFSSFSRMRAPMVAAVQGAAAGIGFSLALVADFTIASEKAKFVMAYTDAGLSPDGGSTYLLPKVIGIKRAKELMLTNRVLTANEAEQWGIINQVTSPEEVYDEALALAKKLAAGPTDAFGAVKTLLNSCYSESMESQMFMEGSAISKNAGLADGQEGLAAFCEKRTPNFSGNI